MNTADMVNELDKEISKLQNVRSILSGIGSLNEHADYTPKVDEPTMQHKKRTMSASARRRISSAQKARWAKFNIAKQG